MEISSKTTTLSIGTSRLTRVTDNAGLRAVMEARLPLYFHGIVKGIYRLSPVYIIEELPNQLAFRIAVADTAADTLDDLGDRVAEEPTRGYRARVVLQRLHQASFSQRVLRAYRNSCAVCHLKHRELLDAAHIVPDKDPLGIPSVTNGLALCKLHHAAFDSYIIGISPARVVEVRQDILAEEDGPMLLHGLKGVHRQPIALPRQAADYPALRVPGNPISGVSESGLTRRLTADLPLGGAGSGTRTATSRSNGGPPGPGSLRPGSARRRGVFQLRGALGVSGRPGHSRRMAALLRMVSPGSRTS